MLKRRGFTLAEVLITLGIIGVVAAMTIPNLVAKYQENTWIHQFRQTYAILFQAYTMTFNEYGQIEAWGLVANDYD